jgi:hypothetical protein
MEVCNVSVADGSCIRAGFRAKCYQCFAVGWNTACALRTALGSTIVLAALATGYSMTDEQKKNALAKARSLLPATAEFDEHRSIKAIAAALLRAEAHGISWATEEIKEAYMDDTLNRSLEDEYNFLEGEAASLDSSI